MRPIDLVFIFLFFIMFICGCSSYYSYPSMDESSNNACYEASKCSYFNKENSDKSICVKLWERCGRIITWDKCKGEEDPNDCWKTIE